jgi:hypothetical protein
MDVLVSRSEAAPRMNFFSVKITMDPATKSADELRLLRVLCDANATRAHRIELLQSLEGHDFLDPEHRVVFESIRFLFSHGDVSAARLAVHLNNRGFPDVDLEEYFPSASSNPAKRKNTDRKNV